MCIFRKFSEGSTPTGLLVYINRFQHIQDFLRTVVPAELIQLSVDTKEKMAEVEVANNLEEFISSGRTGRRNAMADILDSKHASTSTAGIDLDMSGLKCSEDNKSQMDKSNSSGSSDGSGS